MSWINDARNEARLKKMEKEEIERQNKLAIKRKLDQSLNIFHLATQKTRLEIEKILNELKRNGFTVSEAREGWTEDCHEDCGHYLYNSNENSRAYDERLVAYVYAIYWVIKEPSTGIGFPIYLGLNKRDRLSIFEESPDDFIPTATAQQVQEKLKLWLVEILSK